MNKGHFEVIILGGGVAGLSAALWCDELGLNGLVLESENEYGGQLLWTYNAIENYLGTEAKDGRDLQTRFLRQIEKRSFASHLETTVTQVDLTKKTLTAGGQLFSYEFFGYCYRYTAEETRR